MAIRTSGICSQLDNQNGPSQAGARLEVDAYFKSAQVDAMPESSNQSHRKKRKRAKAICDLPSASYLSL